MSKVYRLQNYNFHIYIISKINSDQGPVKIGYSHHPPSRLKELQTGNPDKLTLWGSISFKEKIPAELTEKILHKYLKDNNFNAIGEWFKINVYTALRLLECFPISRGNLKKPIELNKEGILSNSIDLIHEAFRDDFIDEDQYDSLSEIFNSGDNDLYEFNDFSHEIKNLISDE